MLTAVLSEWVQFYGPMSTQFVGTTLGLEERRLSLAIEDMVESQRVVAGKLVTGGKDDDICDSENFEILLRLARRAAIPAFEPKEIEALPLFLAQYQGVTTGGDDVDYLFRCIEQLRCLPAPAALWESEILAARLHPYNQAWLDGIMQESDVKWVGFQNHHVTFCFGDELPLLQDAGSVEPEEAKFTDDFTTVFPGKVGRYDFSTLLTATDYSASELSQRLWEGVWQGRVTNDSVAALRKGIMNRFQVTAASAGTTLHHGHRAGFSRWKGSIPFAGNWYLLPTLGEGPEDAIEQQEKAKDRARVLLDRYGILFRELLDHELPAFRWSKVFRALRLMELSGEILSGYFFEGIPGPQFISHAAFQTLQRRLSERAIFWLNATDPASLCGIQADALRRGLPSRIAGSHIVYHGRQLVLTSRRNGQDLTILVPPDDPDLQQYFGFLHNLLNRAFQPMRRIAVSTINGEEATGSPYLDALKSGFHVVSDYRSVILYKS